MKRLILMLAIFGLIVFSSGCASSGSTTQTKRGAVIGGLIGAGTGAIIGHQSGRGLEGAAIGGAVGAIGGGAVGSAQDEQNDRDARRNY
jgi:uncharacterized protein YcfJ